MKRSVLLFLCLTLFALFLVSCADGTCHHLNMAAKEFLPSCDEEGYLLHTCPDCGYSYKSDFSAPVGHSIAYTVVPPTCEEEGYTEFSCTACDYFYRSEYTSPAGHNLQETILAPTCNDPGYTEFACTKCDYSYRADETAPTGHSYTENVIASTCSDAGYTEHICLVCGYSYASGFEDALGHKLKKQVTSPTCTAAGYTQYTCEFCSLSYRTEYVSATGHKLTSATTAPTLTHAGYLRNTCAACGISFISDQIYYSELLFASGNTANRITAKGVDLSKHNGTVDFAAIKESGIDFVILRACTSVLNPANPTGTNIINKDSKFDEYYAAAREAGLDIGCYLYTESRTVAGIRTDTQKLLGYLEGKQFTYPVYLDMETDAQKTLGGEKLINMAKEFATTLLDAGYFPGLYTNPDWLKVAYGSAYDPSLIMDIWLAHHNPATYQSNPNYYVKKYGIWQYCGSEVTEEFETVPGVDGRVDIDVCYKNYPALIKKYGYNGY